MRDPEFASLEDGSIDAGLVILDAVRAPGQRLTQEEIAHVCGCSRGYIWLLEKTAREKLQRRFSRLREEGRI